MQYKSIAVYYNGPWIRYSAFTVITVGARKMNESSLCLCSYPNFCWIDNNQEFSEIFHVPSRAGREVFRNFHGNSCVNQMAALSLYCLHLHSVIFRNFLGLSSCQKMSGTFRNKPAKTKWLCFSLLLTFAFRWIVHSSYTVIIMLKKI